MNFTRRSFLQGTAAITALATLGLPASLLDDDDIITVRTISEETLRFRVVEETYLDAYDCEQVRPRLFKV